MDARRTDGANRFGLDPRPPSPPPAWIRGPWWSRWAAIHLAVAGLYAAWALTVVDGHDRAVVAWIAAPYLATPMVVLVVLVARSRRRGPQAETPRAFAWGAGLSLLSVVLFTFGYAGWPFMLASTPAALGFLVYALTEPPTGRRGRTALVSMSVVIIGLVIGLVGLSRLEAVACWSALVCGIAYLVRQRRTSR